MGFASTLYRQERYREYTPVEPAHANFEQHTMGAQNLARYIRGKKFSPDQHKAIAKAYRENLPIKVLGAYREDLEFLGRHLGYEVDLSRVLHHRRDGKVFNMHRQLTCWARSSSGSAGLELWIVVFPSTSYVDHVAELVQAMIDKRTGKKDHDRVRVLHFPDLEDRLVLWTGFRDTVRSYVRAGDVVAIGNVDLLIPGLEDVGFSSLSPDWVNFGLDDMFGVRLMRNNTSRSNLVLIGMAECFWGEASAKYVDALLQAGARHVLYGSKAATLLGKDVIGKIGAPRAFGNIGSNRKQGAMAHFPELWDELQGMFKLSGIEAMGTGITVPTVIGEDHAQWKKYRYANPACMDCENGHIAETVAAMNARLAERGVFNEYAKFVSVHFITDHIHRPSEDVRTTTGNLTVKPKPEIRDNAFRRIGQFFGIYALRFGLRDHIPLPPEKAASRSAAALQFDDMIKNVGELIDSGMGREAALTLLRMFPPNELPPMALLALTYIGQKCGYSNLFQRAYAEFQALKQSNLDEATRSELLRLKFLTQVGDYSSAEEIGRKLLGASLPAIRSMHQSGALHRRLAIAYAGQLKSSEARQALDAADERSNRHDTVTNKLFRAIVELQLVRGTVDRTVLVDASTKLSEIRADCGRLKPRQYGWWHTNPEKCAIAALFLEAAYYLDLGDERDFQAGMKRLFAAHSFNARYGANERSDAYGEVLGAVRRQGSAVLLSLAMRADPEAQFEFQEVVRAKYKYGWLDQLTKQCLSVQRAAPSLREPIVRTLW